MALLSLLPDAGWLAWLGIVLPISFAVYCILWVVYAQTWHPLAKIPGPWWAGASRIWIMYRMYAGDIEIVQRSLHDKYGPLVRIAPDEISVSDPEAIPRIYPIQRPLQKTNWYHVFSPAGYKPTLFSETNEDAHTAYRKIVGGVYALSSILKNEADLDRALDLFMKRIDGFAERKESFDFGLWLEMYAWDNVGTVFFGDQFGFLENSCDHGNYIRSIHLAMPFLSVVSNAPVYVRPLLMVGAAAIPKLLKAVLAVDGILKTAIRETKKGMERSAEATSKRYDIISQLLYIAQENGRKANFTHHEVTIEMWTAVMAGSDSTAIALRAVFYYLMKHPEKLQKIRAEVDNAFASGILTHPVQYSQAISLPYLGAVVKEATRLFPSLSVTMPRHAPAQGIELCGTHIPSGYIVGMNPAVVQHDKTIFGEDPADFWPERWLQGEERNRAMEKAMIVFGAGNHQCIGKHLANAEIFKVIPTILRKFTFEMAHDRPWVTHNASFIMQTDIICNFTRRDVE